MAAELIDRVGHRWWARGRGRNRGYYLEDGDPSSLLHGAPARVERVGSIYGRRWKATVEVDGVREERVDSEMNAVMRWAIDRLIEQDALPAAAVVKRDQYGSYEGHRWNESGPCGCENCRTRAGLE